MLASEPRLPIWLWLVHLVGAPLACFFVCLFADELAAELLRTITKSRSAEVALAYVVYGLVGLGLGCVVQILVPRSYGSGGKWAWLGPSAFLVWGVLDTLMRDPRHLFGFFGFPPYRAEAFVLIVVIWPSVATWFYSVGIVIGNSFRGSERTRER